MAKRFHRTNDELQNYFSKTPSEKLTKKKRQTIASHLEICSQCASLRGFIEECDEIADSIHFCTLSEEEKTWAEKMKSWVNNMFDQTRPRASEQSPITMMKRIQQEQKEINLKNQEKVYRRNTYNYEPEYKKLSPTSLSPKALASLVEKMSPGMTPLAVIAAILYFMQTQAVAQSIAVVPFKLLNLDSYNNNLGVGMAETLTLKLGTIKNLIVRPTFLPTDQTIDTTAVGKASNSKIILTGTIVTKEEKILITIELTNTKDGKQLWVNQFESSKSSIFTLEDTICQAVAEKLDLSLTDEERKLLNKHYTDSIKAYEYYMQGRAYWKQTSARFIDKAIEEYNKAIAEDPGYALAYIGLADAYIIRCNFGTAVASPIQEMPKAKAAVEKALAIDPTLAEAYTSLAQIAHLYDHDLYTAEQACKKAIAIKPNYALTHHCYAHWLKSEKRFDEAINEIELAHKLDPKAPIIDATRVWIYYFADQNNKALALGENIVKQYDNFSPAHAFLGFVYEKFGRFTEAIAEFQKAVELDCKADPETTSVALGWLGHIHAVLGNRAQALSIIQELREASQKRYVSPYLMAVIYAGLDDKDEAFEWLQRACDERSGWLIHLPVEPALNSLRGDPRFNDLLVKTGFYRIIEQA